MTSMTLGDWVVWRLVDRMEAEADPLQRYALRTLLIEQENLFGTAAERLERAEAHMAAGRFKIDELETTIAALRDRGANVAQPEQVLRNLKEILATFDQYHALCLEAVRRGLDWL
jgi:phage shock protein A